MMVQIQPAAVPQTPNGGKSAPEPAKAQDGLFQRLMNSAVPVRARQGEKDRGETRDGDTAQTPQASVLWALPGSVFPILTGIPELSADAGQTGAATAVAGVLQAGTAAPENTLRQTLLSGGASIEPNRAGPGITLQDQTPAQNVPAASFAVPEASAQTASSAAE